MSENNGKEVFFIKLGEAGQINMREALKRNDVKLYRGNIIDQYEGDDISYHGSPQYEMITKIKDDEGNIFVHHDPERILHQNRVQYATADELQAIYERNVKSIKENIAKMYSELRNMEKNINQYIGNDRESVQNKDIRSEMRNKIKSESLGRFHIPTIKEFLERKMIGKQLGKSIFIPKQSAVLTAGENVIELAAHYDPFYDHSDRPDPMFTISLNGEHIWGLKYELNDNYLEEEDVNFRYRSVEGKLNSLKLTELIQHLKNTVDESQIVCENKDIIKEMNDKNLKFKELYGYAAQDMAVQNITGIKDRMAHAKENLQKGRNERPQNRNEKEMTR